MKRDSINHFLFRVHDVFLMCRLNCRQQSLRNKKNSPRRAQHFKRKFHEKKIDKLQKTLAGNCRNELHFCVSMCLAGYAFLVTWITAFVMVVVHERVPDSKRYPPLPDIFLDNVPHIGWAFWACEVTGAMLFAIWICVLVFHKYR
jgi:hypothetical protein